MIIDIESPEPSWASYQLYTTDLLLVLKIFPYINGQIHIWTILVLTVQGLLRESYLINTTIGPIWTYETVFCHRFTSNCFKSFRKSHLSQLSDFDEIVYTTEPSLSSQKSFFFVSFVSKKVRAYRAFCRQKTSTVLLKPLEATKNETKIYLAYSC